MRIAPVSFSATWSILMLLGSVGCSGMGDAGSDMVTDVPDAATSASPGADAVGPGAGGDGNRIASDLSGFLDALAEGRCEAARRCAWSELGFAQSHTTVEHCVEQDRAWLSRYEAAQIAWSPDAATVCLDAASRAVCAADPHVQDGLPWDCRDALLPTGVTGAPCLSGLDCVSGICDCDQTCVTSPSFGADEEGWYAPRCGDIGCEGDVCDDTDPPCGSNLQCVEGSCLSAASLRVQAEGEPCSSGDDPESGEGLCEPGLACDEGTCRGPLPEDADCSGAAGWSLCPPGTSCQGPSTDFRCRAFKSDGEPCFGAGGGQPCDVGLLCSGSSCVPAHAPAGSPCNLPEQCASRQCDQQTSTCVDGVAASCP